MNTAHEKMMSSRTVVSVCCRMRFSILMLVGLALCLAHLLLIYQWMTSKSTFHKPNDDEMKALNSSILSVFNVPPVLDSSRQYYVMKWIIKPRTQRQFKSLNISGGETTLVTQCSPEYLHLLIDLQKTWQGSISLSLFASTLENIVLSVTMLTKLRLCLPTILESVAVHLVIPADIDLGNTQFSMQNVDCSDVRDVFHRAATRHNVSNYDASVQYPNNLLRNVAVDAAVSDFVLVIDIDLHPSANLFSQFQQLIRRTVGLNYAIAYVVPVFEILHGENMPRDRATLLQLWRRGVVRPFYLDACYKCHNHTDYERWMSLPDVDASRLRVAYDVVWHDRYEPFYIVPHFAARYDERFRQYGFNRISQVSS